MLHSGTDYYGENNINWSLLTPLTGAKTITLLSSTVYEQRKRPAVRVGSARVRVARLLTL